MRSLGESQARQPKLNQEQLKKMGKRRMKDKSMKRASVNVAGSSKRPRLSVFRSNKHLYAQLIDDDKAVTLVATSDKGFKGKYTKTDIAGMVGETLAKRAKTKKISKVVFDRGSYRYHGRIKALAEGARKGGLKF